MPARLLFFSDFVCPFCTVAERGVLTPLLADYDLELDWCGFQLHPSTPKGGAPLSALFGPRAEAMGTQVVQFASTFGVTLLPQGRLPNTRRTLAVAEYARDQGQLHPFREAAMTAHWNRRLDIEADSVLRELASGVGLDADAAVAAADSTEYQARVDAMGAEAARYGVHAIPTYVFLPAGWSLGMETPPRGSARPVRVVGCQPRKTVEDAARTAGATPRS